MLSSEVDKFVELKDRTTWERAGTTQTHYLHYGHNERDGSVDIEATSNK